MIVSYIRLKNWRNFQSVEVPLQERMFLAGPNACGKSNFLDVFRFLRDIAKKGGGGLQQAVADRGGLSKIRCLAARRDPQVEIEIRLANGAGNDTLWTYAMGIRQETAGHRNAVLDYERVWRKDQQIVNRPDERDEKDSLRLTQTHLEQISANEEFRDIATYFGSVTYLHLVPQLLRNPEAFAGPGTPGDPFGRNFLERLARTTKGTRNSRLKRIERALIRTVPQLKQLAVDKDEAGIPHLSAVYDHWRPRGAKQREDQFSDGTLRMIGLFWALLEGKSLLLLEEPELSLHVGIVRMLAPLVYRLQKKKGFRRQVFMSTHSADLLSDGGIDPSEVLVMTPSAEGTQVKTAAAIQEVRDLLEGGFSMAEAVMPRTEPAGFAKQLEFDFFDDGPSD